MKKDIYQDLTNLMIEKMEDSEFELPWYGMGKTIYGDNYNPKNPFSGTEYRGGNFITCLLIGHFAGYNSQRWGTFKQWSDAGCKIRKGEKSTGINYFAFIKDKKDPEKEIPIAKSYRVFSAEQVEGVEVEEEVPTLDESERLEIVENYIAGLGAKIVNEENRAYYVPSEHYINMPAYKKFKSAYGYYSTLFHELTHWTQKPLKRKEGYEWLKTDKEKKAYEELVAELGSLFMSAHFGLQVEKHMENHSGYIKGWLEAMKQDKKYIWKACQDAQKAVDYLLGE